MCNCFLSIVEREKRDFAPRIDIQSHRKMPKIGASKIACVEDLYEFRSQCAIGLNPREAGQKIHRVGGNSFSRDDRPNLGFQEI